MKRKIKLVASLALTLVIALTVILTSFYSVVTAVETTDIDFTIEQGSGVGLTKVSANNFEFGLRQDPCENPKCSYWFAFNITNCYEETVTFTITNASSSLFWYGVVVPVYSYDGVTWSRVTTYDYSSPTFTFTHTFTEDTALVAVNFMIPFSETEAYLSTINGYSYVTVEDIGNSDTGTHDMWQVTITNSSVPANYKKTIWIITGQHSGEVYGQHMVRGMMEYLVTNDTNPVSLRNNYTFIFMPAMSPDAIVDGRSRSYSKDLNREWDDGQGYMEPEVDCVYDQMESWLTSYDIDLGIDIHGMGSGSSGYISTVPATISNETFHAEAYAIATNITNSCTMFDLIRNETVTGSFYTANYNNFGIQTLLVECPEGQSTWTIASLKAEGVNILEGINDYFGEGEAPPPPPEMTVEDWENFWVWLKQNMDTILEDALNEWKSQQ